MSAIIAIVVITVIVVVIAVVAIVVMHGPEEMPERLGRNLPPLPAAGSKNAITALAIKRGAQVVKPATQSFDGGGGRFIFDFPAFAPTAAITLEMTGKTRTISCAVDQAILAKFR